VNGATIEAYRICDTGAVDTSPLGTGTTGADGSFTVGVGSYTGPVLLLATGGSYVDEATGATKTISDEDPLLGMAIAVNGTASGNISPLTHWATIVAWRMSAEPNTDALLAIQNAVTMVEDYFDVSALLTTVPADLTAGTVAPGNAAEHGAAIAGLSQLADDWGYTDPVWLIEDLASDGADGRFDGEEMDQETLPSWDMASLQLRDAIRDFLDNNTRNLSGLGQGDVGVDEAVEARVVAGSYSSYAWPPLIQAMDVAGGSSAGNTTVQISGEFIDTTSGVEVYFDGVSGTLVTSGPNAVTVRTPSGVAGKVDIDIVNLELGLTTRLPEAFEYYTPGSPSITRIWPDYGPITGGALIELEGLRFDPTATVQIGGMSAEVVQRAVPGLLVARAPAHAAGIVQVQVFNGGSGSNSVSFEYRDQDVGQNLTDGDFAGNWMLYRLGHQYYPNATSSTFATRTSLSFNGAGSASYSETRRTTTPADAAGTPVTSSGTYGYAAFPNGTMFLNLDPAADPEAAEFLRVWTQDEGDVFAGSRMEKPGFAELTVGVRNGSGMNNASLRGNYWFAGLATQYFGSNSDRFFASLLGYAEFDGAGHGSCSLLLSYRETGAPDYYRELFSLTFTYSVASNGNLTLTWDDGTIFRGTLAQAGDFATLVEYDSPGDYEGELGIFFLTKQGNGLMPTSLAGSWYGGGLGTQIEGSGIDEHVYFADRVRALCDTQGVSLMEFADRAISESDTEGHPEESLDSTMYSMSPVGYVAVDWAPPQFLGVVGASRRCQLVAPTWPFGGGSDQNEQICGVLFRNGAFYSQLSLPQAYNFVSLEQFYGNPNSPPAPDEMLFNVSGRMIFDPAVPALLDGMPFLASGIATIPAGPVKIVTRDNTGSVNVSDEAVYPDSIGGYALAGDGRTYLFTSAAAPAILAQVDGENEIWMGQTPPHGDVVMLRVPFQDYTQTGVIALTRETTAAPTVTGDYNVCEFELGFDTTPSPPPSTPGVARTLMSFNNPTAGSFVQDVQWYSPREDGTFSIGSVTASPGTFTINTNGTAAIVGTGPPDVGIVAPDGSALFMVNLDSSESVVKFDVYVRKNAAGTGVDTDGAFTVFALQHSFLDTTSFPPAAAAQVGQFEIMARTNSVVDIGAAICVRTNLDYSVYLSGEFQPGISWTVAGDGSLAISDPGMFLRGGVSDNGRYACVIPGDTAPDDVLHFFFLRQ